jgi:hypothetical protein
LGVDISDEKIRRIRGSKYRRRGQPGRIGIMGEGSGRFENTSRVNFL